MAPKLRVLLLFVLGIAILASCEKQSDVDREKPTIEYGFAHAFPQDCDTIYFGEAFTVKMLLQDNDELGAYSINIHHNFDHHSHTSEVISCDLLPKITDMTGLNPIKFINDYLINEGLSDFETNLTLQLPLGDGSGTFTEGDYHFAITVTDKSGWTTKKGIGIKIMHR